MKKSNLAKAKPAATEAPHPFKKIGIAAVAAAAHAMRPNEVKKTPPRVLPSVLLQDH